MYNNLKDVFFDSKYHVGRGMATYDKSLNSTLFNGLPDISAVVNSETAMNAIVESELMLNAIVKSEVAMNAVVNSDVAKGVIEDKDVPIDLSGSPGEKLLIAGDNNVGYFGIVSASELITGIALASAVGISTGTSQFSDEGWLKFAWGGKIQFVAKKPLRHSISWDDINTAGCVFGTKTVEIGGLTYKVRLMRSGIKDPVANLNGDMHGSEWNRLMLPIHIEAKDKSWAYPAKVEADIPYWGVNFTNEDLHTHSSFGSGSRSWCQETYSTHRVHRGNSGVSSSSTNTPTSASADCGWRPVLELV